MSKFRVFQHTLMITTTVTDFNYRYASDPQRPIDQTLLWVFPFVVERALASLGGRLASLSSDAKRRLATFKRRQAPLDKKGKKPTGRVWSIAILIFKIIDKPAHC